MARQFWDERIEAIDRAELRVIQEHRLVWQIQRCWANSPYYRSHLEAAGFAEVTRFVSTESLVHLPLLRPEGLNARALAFPPDGQLAVAPVELWCDTTSGPAYAPFQPIWSEADLVHRAALVARALWSFGVRPGDRVICPDTVAWRGSVELAVSRIGASLVAAQPGPLAEPGGDRASQPRTLLLDAGAVLAGAAWTELPTSAERSTESAAERTRFVALGDPLVGPVIAAECTARRGPHLAEDHFLVESLDIRTRQPAERGQAGRVVVTQLTREATPLIRFDIGRVGRIDDSPCACGRTLARLLVEPA